MLSATTEATPIEEAFVPVELCAVLRNRRRDNCRHSPVRILLRVQLLRLDPVLRDVHRHWHGDHRRLSPLMSHQSFECPTWVKACILIAGGWALQNSALKWGGDHIRHHAKTDEDEDPYNATKGFWHSHCGWLFYNTTHRKEKYEIRLRRDPIVIWQHRYYWLDCGLGPSAPVCPWSSWTAAGRAESAAFFWVASSECSWS